MKNYPNKKLENYRRRARFIEAEGASEKKAEKTETTKMFIYIFIAIVVLIFIIGFSYKYYKGKQIEVVQPISTFVKALLR